MKAVAGLAQGKLEMTERVGLISVNPPTLPVKVTSHGAACWVNRTRSLMTDKPKGAISGNNVVRYVDLGIEGWKGCV